MELLAVALGPARPGLLSSHKMRQPVEAFSIASAASEPRSTPSVHGARGRLQAQGRLDEAKVARGHELSRRAYCSVEATQRPAVPITSRSRSTLSGQAVVTRTVGALWARFTLLPPCLQCRRRLSIAGGSRRSGRWTAITSVRPCRRRHAVSHLPCDRRAARRAVTAADIAERFRLHPNWPVCILEAGAGGLRRHGLAQGGGGGARRDSTA